jgi:fatty acid desaturase
LEARVAIGLVLLAGVIALPVAVCAWLLGFVSFGNAFLIYILTGWAVVAAGFLSALLGYLANGAGAGNEGETRAVSMKVKPANRG